MSSRSKKIICGKIVLAMLYLSPYNFDTSSRLHYVPLWENTLYEILPFDIHLWQSVITFTRWIFVMSNGTITNVLIFIHKYSRNRSPLFEDMQIARYVGM